jgi:hypothetical protein
MFSFAHPTSLRLRGARPQQVEVSHFALTICPEVAEANNLRNETLPLHHRNAENPAKDIQEAVL